MAQIINNPSGESYILQNGDLVSASGRSFTLDGFFDPSSLGTAVATLDANGHLTASQIPPLSVNDVFLAESADELTDLAAQRGDVALIIPDDTVEESYILADDDPTQESAWKQLGVSYVANAGHAISADTAAKLGTASVVEMTAEEYEAITPDENTYYFVTD